MGVLKVKVDGQWLDVVVGQPGPRGPTGPASTVPGPQGATGPPGPQGSTGAASTVAGPPGPQGSTGPQGAVGSIGATGPASTVPGPQGATGAAGAQGPQGIKGDTGQQGVKGDKGDTGATGPAGSGSSITTGIGAPTNATSALGDYYIDTDTDILYGPKVMPPTVRAFDTRAPVTNVTNITDPIMSGNRLTFAIAGQITALWHFRSPNSNQVAHTMRLWRVTGQTQAATAVTSAESGSGWHSVTLATPVAVAAGESFIVTVDYPSGDGYLYRNTGLYTSDEPNITFNESLYNITLGQYPNVSNGLINLFTDVSFTPTSQWPVAIQAMARGGTVGQVLSKKSTTDFDTQWSNLVESAAYTPVLTAMAVGTGGAPSNTAEYLFIGGTAVGSKGILKIAGNIVFGTTGATFPTATTRIALPPGFSIFPLTTTWHLGAIRFNIAGLTYGGQVACDTANGNILQVFAEVVSGTTVLVNPPTATVPNTWAAGSQLRWTLDAMAVRV